MGNRLSKILVSGIILFLIMTLLSAIKLNAQTAIAPAAGDGSSGNPYQIATWENLYWITQDSDRWDKDYIQTANIDFADASPAITTWDSNNGFTPIGNLTVQFTGTYDGAGFTITGLFINRSSIDYIGMFGATNTGAEIKNVGLINVDITGNDYVGGLAGLNFNGSITNSFSAGSVSGSNYAGGLAGFNSNSSIADSYSTSSVSGSNNYAGGLVGRNYIGTIGSSYSTGSVSGDVFVGGLVGENIDGTSTITNSYSTGSASGSFSVGGLVGQQNDGSISYSYSTGSVGGSTNAGGLLGYNNGGTINSSFWNTETSGQSSSAGGTGKITTQMKTLSTFTNAGWDFEGETVNGTDDYWVKDPLEIKNNGYPFLAWQAEPSGNGTSGNPYQIETLFDLNWLSQNPASWDKYFIQTASINASSTTTWDGAAGFTPIGNSSTNFTGTYDGGDFGITGLFIDRSSTDYIGMFGFTGSGSEIKNIGLTEVNITGNEFTGGLVGNNSGGSISGSYSDGSVEGSGGETGGLVGFNTGTIMNSYSKASVDGTTSVGGLAGQNTSSGSITKSFSAGSVNGDSQVGGLAGSNSGVITGSFWDLQTSLQATSSGGTGKTTAEMKELSTFLNAGWDFEIETANGTNNYWDIDNINGTSFDGYPFLAWENTIETLVEDITPTISIGNPSSSSTITGPVTYGITYSDAGTINLTAGDVTLNTTGTATGTVAVTNGTTANPTVTINNITGVGSIGISINAGTATSILGSLNAASAGPSTTFTADSRIPLGSGTSVDPYLIAILGNLQWVSENISSWDKDFLQTANIDASSTSTWDSGAGFTPIGNETTNFTGNYDGNGFTITGLFIDRASTISVAMFGYTSSGAVIKNIGLLNVNITGVFVTGSLVGLNAGTLTNSYSTGSVSVGLAVGGLVGQNNGSISGSYSTASVSGSTSAGGLAGQNSNSGSITNSYSTGSVSGSTNVGGFMGSNSGAINSSFWDTETSNQPTTGVGSGSSSGVTGENTAQMKTLSTFTNAGWDFVIETDNGTNDTWDMDISNQITNNGYPFLSWQNGSATALPVELTSFTAEIVDSVVILKWQTATEVNNYGFEVERASSSTMPVQGGETAVWETIGFVPGHGNSNSPKSYSYEDNDKDKDYDKDGTIEYRLKQIDTDGSFEYYGTIVEVNLSITGLEEETIPKKFSLSQNYPNPFNPRSNIKYEIVNTVNVNLTVYNIVGEEVMVLVNQEQSPGNYRVEIDGSKLSSGVYVYILTAGEFTSVKKLMLMK